MRVRLTGIQQFHDQRRFRRACPEAPPIPVLIRSLCILLVDG